MDVGLALLKWDADLMFWHFDARLMNVSLALCQRNAGLTFAFSATGTDCNYNVFCLLMMSATSSSMFRFLLSRRGCWEPPQPGVAEFLEKSDSKIDLHYHFDSKPIHWPHGSLKRHWCGLCGLHERFSNPRWKWCCLSCEQVHGSFLEKSPKRLESRSPKRLCDIAPTG